MSSRFAIRRALVLAAVLCALFAGVAVAGAAPKIVEASYTNAVAYELKSLQWTHFYATFDQPVWAVLTVHDGAGREVARVFDGAVPEANKRFWFPSWNGKSAHGRHLPSSAGYTWKLRVVRGGQTAEASGRIAICKVLFTISGTLENPDWDQRYPQREGQYWQRYMIEGPANVYVSAKNEGSNAAFGLNMPGEVNAYRAMEPNAYSWSSTTQGERHVGSRYLRPPAWDIQRGIMPLTVMYWVTEKLSYQITVLQ